MISEAEMIENQRQEIAEITQAIDRLAEVIRTVYAHTDSDSSLLEEIEEVFQDLNLDL